MNVEEISAQANKIQFRNGFSTYAKNPILIQMSAHVYLVKTAELDLGWKV